MPLSITVQNPTSDGTGASVELPAEIFDVTPNLPLIHQVVVAQLAAARQGTHSTKTRGEVAGGGTKPYRQKGTGRARQGSIRAPQFTGGGIVHGPTPRSYDQRTPKKMKAAALRGALSDRARNDRVHVVSVFVEGELPSTRTAAESLAKIAGSPHVLVVAERADELTWKSLRNLPAVHLLEPGQLNTYDVLVSDDVVFTKGALDAFLAGPAATRSGRELPPEGRSANGAGSSAEAVAADVESAEDEAVAAASQAEIATTEAIAAKVAEAEAEAEVEALEGGPRTAESAADRTAEEEDR